nr:immunoglobulin light chain junction region [Macaca mulatta]MOW31686.1 immunoglobulin light chain junction region [Macaca mulatta]MOW31754.1 immunoglobulin light chain junction region [Macaca mulatta]MOW31947.1 immunoglobulin light chain junction region [Macaca mulatta]
DYYCQSYASSRWVF